MSEATSYRALQPGEEAEVCALILEAFHSFVSHELTEEGIRTFSDYVQPDAMAARMQVDHFVLVAVEEGTMAGALEIRKNTHLSLLFVHPMFHRRGIARGLFRHALQAMREANPALEQVTVNASRYALGVYEKLGFYQTEPEQVVQGIIFIPMVLDLKESDDV